MQGPWKQPDGPARPPVQPQQLQVPPPSSVVLTPASPERVSQAAINGRGRSLDGPSGAPNATPSSNGHTTSQPRPPPIHLPPAQPVPVPVSITVSGEGNLSVRPQVSSRDSQISLPEEAKRYYATMASPAASPGMKFNFPSAPSSPLKLETYGERSDDSSSVSGMSSTLPAGLPGDSPSVRSAPGGERGRVGGTTDRAGSVTTTEEGAEFLDMEDEDSAYDSGANGASSGSAQAPSFDDTSSLTAFTAPSDGGDMRRHEPEITRRPSGADDFPLPPSTTNGPAQNGTPVGTPSRQGNSLDTRESRPSISTADSHTYQHSLASSQTLVTDQPPASPFPLPVPQGPPRMGFRALPLLAEDLPYTEVVVSTSSIRPNDRGKEVLSFIVNVDPGRGKESWRVEKLYSDVLGLDARVRAAVGRSASKRLASLPEGRLWRDHAPAKVDQRKVRGLHPASSSPPPPSSFSVSVFVVCLLSSALLGFRTSAAPSYRGREVTGRAPVPTVRRQLTTLLVRPRLFRLLGGDCQISSRDIFVLLDVADASIVPAVSCVLFQVSPPLTCWTMSLIQH